MPYCDQVLGVMFGKVDANKRSGVEKVIVSSYWPLQTT